MKQVTDWLKTKILTIALIPHIFVLYNRIHYKKSINIYEDRPIWVVKVLAKRITDDFFEEDASEQSINGMYRLTNEACIELKRRQSLSIA